MLLIDSWIDQAAIDAHHASPMMATIAALREKYDLHMTVERFLIIAMNSNFERRVIRETRWALKGKTPGLLRSV